MWGICSNHHTTRKGIVFQTTLVNNSARLPKPIPYLLGNRSKKNRTLLCLHFCCVQIFCCAYFACIKRSWTVEGHLQFLACLGHKLQQSHLCCCIPHCYAVWSKINIIFPRSKTLQGLVCMWKCEKQYFSASVNCLPSTLRAASIFAGIVLYNLFNHLMSKAMIKDLWFLKCILFKVFIFLPAVANVASPVTSLQFVLLFFIQL